MTDHIKPVATSGRDPYDESDFKAKPVPPHVREHFASVGREMTEKHAAEGMPEPTLRQSAGGFVEIVRPVPDVGDIGRQRIDSAEERDTLIRAAYERGRTEMLAELTKRLPQNVEQAAAQAHAALLRWQGLADDALRATVELTKHDELGGAVRQRCVEDLMQPGVVQHTGGGHTERKALAPSVAQTAASNHPTYVEHKQRTAKLTTARDNAKLAADTAYEALLNAREYLTMWRVRNEGGVVGKFVAALNRIASPMQPDELLKALTEAAHRQSVAQYGTADRATLGDVVRRTEGVGLDGRAPR